MLILDPTFLLLSLSAAVYVAMLGVMLWRGRLRASVHARSSWLLMAYILVSLGWVAVLDLQRVRAAGFDLYALARTALYLLLALSVVFFQLTRLFQRRALGMARGKRGPLTPGGLWWLLGAVWLLLALALFENPLRLPDVLFQIGTSQFMRVLVAFGLLAAGWAFFLGGALVLTLRDYNRTAAPLHRNRIKYWSMALLFEALGGLLLLFQQVLASSLLHLLAVGLVMYVLLTYKLPDLRLATRGMTSYTLTTLISVVVYTIAILVVQALLRLSPLSTGAGLTGQVLLAGLALAVALAVLFNPLLAISNRIVQRLFHSVRYDPRQTLSEYSMSISNVLDLEILATITIGLLNEAMDVSHGLLVTVTHMSGDGVGLAEDAAAGADGESSDGEQTQAESKGFYFLRPTSGIGQTQPLRRLAADNPVAQSLSREHHPLTQYDIDLLPRFQAMDDKERKWLDAWNMDVYVPIYVKDAWIGLLALGPKVSGDRYYDEDLIFLQTLADQTAVALENSRLFENLKERNAENERLNRQLTTANAELARLDQAKTDFINIASHELRTPLTQVMGYNDILYDMVKTNQVQPQMAMQMTEMVRKAARRLEEIVETMFDVSKLDTKTLDLVRGQVTLASIITVAIDTWQKGMEERNLAVAVKGISDLPPIFADSKRMVQVFSHLIQNAIKSTPDGGQIHITGRLIEPESETSAPYVEVVVSDTGIGIADDDLERIFDKFYRVGNVLLHSSGDTKFKGAGPGLGLTIARGIVEAHGGRIWAESPGYDEDHCPGSSLHVLLPLLIQSRKGK